MARRGRNRKPGVKRHADGKIAKPTTRQARVDRTRIGPTDEMEAIKERTNGMEANNPLSYLPLTDIQREALEKYFSRRRAVWPISAGSCPIGARHVGDYDPDRDPNRLKSEPMTVRSENADKEAEQRFKEADDALLKGAGPVAHRQVVGLYSFVGSGNRVYMTASIAKGADALALYFRHGSRRRAA